MTTEAVVCGREAVAELLAGVAWELAQRVRTDDPAAVHAWLLEQVPAGEWPSFAVVLAAHIPAGGDQTDLLAWSFPSKPEPEPAPKPAAARRSTRGPSREDEALHDEFVRRRAAREHPDDIPQEITDGHNRYLRATAPAKTPAAGQLPRSRRRATTQIGART